MGDRGEPGEGLFGDRKVECVRHVDDREWVTRQDEKDIRERQSSTSIDVCRGQGRVNRSAQEYLRCRNRHANVLFLSCDWYLAGLLRIDWFRREKEGLLTGLCRVIYQITGVPLASTSSSAGELSGEGKFVASAFCVQNAWKQVLSGMIEWCSERAAQSKADQVVSFAYGKGNC